MFSCLASLLPAPRCACFICCSIDLQKGIIMKNTIEYDFHAMMRPVPVTAKFGEPGYFIWCGSMVKGGDGKYHLFYSRWLKRFGFNAWVTHSEVAHAVADSPLGPYRHVNLALPARGQQYWDGLCTHNPTAFRAADGKYYLYYMGTRGEDANAVAPADEFATNFDEKKDVVEQCRKQPLNWDFRNNQRIGVAVADAPDGPWRRFDQPLVATTPGFYDALCCNNPSVAEWLGHPAQESGQPLGRMPKPRYLMVYKAVGDKGQLPFGGPVVHCVATSDSPTGPFQKHANPIFVKEGVPFAAEDPFIWCDGQRYWAIVKDNAGNFTGKGKSLALFQSDDGFDWKPAKNVFVTTADIQWAERQERKLVLLERPQLYRENGKPVALFCAAMDAAADTFNVQIPLCL